MSLVVARPEVGMKRVSTSARLNWLRYERSIMVEMRAALTPTSLALYRRAARVQYMRPRTAVTRLLKISA